MGKLAKLIHIFKNLYRLPTSLQVTVLIYYIKKIFYVKPKTSEMWISKCFYYLILTKGICRENMPYELIIHLPSGIDLISRKEPSSDIDVFFQVWVNKQYLPVIDLMKGVLNDYDNIKIIDAGGNVGYTALYFKQIYPKAHIIVVEPEISNFVLLEKNLKLNKYQDIIPLRAGIWKRQSYLEVNKDFRDGKGWSYYVQEASYPTKLKGYSVTDLLKKYKWERIDLLKIDIEGGERYLFENEKQAKTFLSITKFIAIKIHDEFNIRDKIYKCLADNRFEYFNVGELTIGRNRDYV